MSGRRRGGGRLALHGAAHSLRALVLLCLYIPVILIVVLSFQNSSILQFPPHSWGLRQYRVFLGSASWLSAVTTSVEISAVSAAISVVAGLLLVIAIHRSSLPLKGLLQLVGISPLILPGVAYALALYVAFVQVRIEGSVTALVLTYIVIGLPLVLLIVGPAMSRASPDLELVAMTLGASRVRAMAGITLRILLPSLAAAFIFAFIYAFDDAVFISFVGGPGTTTLSEAIFDSVRVGIDPAITAAATLLMAAVGLVSSLAILWRNRA